MEKKLEAPRYKIALVSDWYYPRIGGVEYAINALARYLVERGHHVHIITKKITGTCASEQDGKIDIIRIENKSFSEHLLTPKAFQTLKKQITQGGYDVVHAHGIDSPLALASLIISRRNNISSIITNHSQIGSDFLGLPKRLLLKYFLRYANATIAVSHAVLKETACLFSGPLYIVPNGVDNTSPNGTLVPHEVTGEKIVITTVARMVKRKGVSDFVQMAIHLLKTHKNLLFILVGDGPLKKKLEQVVSRQGGAQNFLFIGHASRATVLNILGQTSIFVSTSRQEAFGIAILEAFYKKVPVIARIGTGAAALIRHNETGFLANNIHELSKTVEQLIENDSLCKSVALSAYNELPRYRWEHITKTMESIYLELTHQHELQS